MARLSSPIAHIKSHYQVVVVGSGYGGAIAASRLSRAGQQVCVLERGRELQPGEYPDTPSKALRETQIDIPGRPGIPGTGLYDIRINDDINVFVGCGLGGTSLINANVSLRPDERVFEDPCWPEALRKDLTTELAAGFRRVREMLRPVPYPLAPLLKLRTLERAAQGLGARVTRLPINVNFYDGVNHAGVRQLGCRLCGDCVSGCNYGAKNTVLMNYLPDARRHGAEIYTQAAVRRIERSDGRWRVHYELLDSGREKFDAPAMFLTADRVVLAAGTLGTTEILLRSRDEGLSMSDRLGCGFSGNGDVLAFGYNGDKANNAVGFGPRRPDDPEPVGPNTTGLIDLRKQREQPLNEGIVIEEGSVPGALAAVLPLFLGAAATLIGRAPGAGPAFSVEQQALRAWRYLQGARGGAVRNTQIFLVMTHDDGSGHMYLEKDRLRVAWPGVEGLPIFERVNRVLRDASAPLRATYVRNPLKLTTVHPLGGCCMADDATHGVVNHEGRVFCGRSGNTVYDSLYVCDGSVVPRPLGVNPLLTISALAERTCALLVDHLSGATHRTPGT